MTTETKTEARERQRMSDEEFSRLERMDVTHPMFKERAALLFYEEADRARKAEASLAAALSALRAEHQRTQERWRVERAELRAQLSSTKTLLESARHYADDRNAAWQSACEETLRAETHLAEAQRERDDERKRWLTEMQEQQRHFRALLDDAEREAPRLIEALRARLTKAGVPDPGLGLSDHIGVALDRMSRAAAALAASEEKVRGMEARLRDLLNNKGVADVIRQLHEIEAALSPSAGPACPGCGRDDGQHKFSCPEQGARGPIVSATRDDDGVMRASTGPASEAKLCPHCDSPYENSAPCTCLSTAPASEAKEADPCPCGERNCDLPRGDCDLPHPREGCECNACESRRRTLARAPASEEPKR